MGEYVEGKNYGAVDHLYNGVQSTEYLICHYLNQNMPKALRESGIFFEIQTSGGQFMHHDLELVHIDSKRERTVLARVEFEFGRQQKDWDLEFPRQRWHGINLLIRKDYDKNVDLFIKCSPTYNSLFAIDCRKNFVDKNFHNDIAENESSIEFVTNEGKYELTWEKIEKHTFKVDEENKRIIDGNVCLIENDPRWKLFYRFIWRRFVGNLNGYKR